MILKFWGAARTVTGSMHLLQLDHGLKILLDCGLYQGQDSLADDFNRSFPCDPSEIDLLILSHAHIDHCGNIPQLVKQGFRGKVFCTHATYDLTAVLLADSAGIQEKEAEDENRWRHRRGLDLVEPLYTMDDVAPALENFVTLSYDNWETIAEGVDLLFLDAGHMLGSASVSLRIQEHGREVSIGFTGDIGRPGSPILRDPHPMPQADYVISESTYGGARHEPIGESKDTLLRIVREACVERRGKLIIPAFSVGRTQNIVHTLDQLHTEGRLPRIPVYVDSPLAVNASEVFQAHPECFDEETRAYLRRDPNPFGFKGLQYLRSAEESKRLNSKEGPFIVIASSGMLNAGRILHHLRNGIEDDRNTVLITGYCAEGTLGARLLAGAETVRIHGEEYAVRASIQKLNSYSGHADQYELGAFLLRSFDPDLTETICLVHGEEDRATRFQNYLESKGYPNVFVPARGESILI